jgi:hypothetical protein
VVPPPLVPDDEVELELDEPLALDVPESAGLLSAFAAFLYESLR